MIGDNPASDIQGINNIKKIKSKYNWKSILVKTGIYQPFMDSNDADYIVSDFKEAIDLIFDIEGI